MSDIYYDDKTNRIMIPMYLLEQNIQTDMVGLPVHTVRRALPVPATLGEQIAELKQLIHEMHKEKLVNVQAYFAEIARMGGGIEKSRKRLLDCDLKEVKRMKEVLKSWIDQKNVLKERRFAIGLLRQEEARVRTLIARLETTGDE